MKLTMSAATLVFASTSFAGTVSHSDAFLPTTAASSVPNFSAYQLSASIAPGSPTPNLASQVSIPHMASSAPTPMPPSTGLASSLSMSGGAATLSYGRGGSPPPDTLYDAAYASGFLSDGTPLIATEERDWSLFMMLNWVTNPGSPNFAIRIPGTSTYSTLANVPVRMFTDGMDAYVLEALSAGAGFEVQKFTLSSGAFTLDWSQTISDGSIPKDIMTSASHCLVISDQPTPPTYGPGEIFVLSKSTGSTASSNTTAPANDEFVRFATGPDQSSGAFSTGSGGSLVYHAFIVGNSPGHETVTQIDYSGSSLSTSTASFAVDLGFLTSPIGGAIGGVVDPSSHDVFVAGFINSGMGVHTSKVSKFPYGGGTVTYVMGGLDAPLGVGESNNGHIYLLDYASATSATCDIYEFNTSLGTVSSNTGLTVPMNIYKDIAVVTSGSSDYVFWTEYGWGTTFPNSYARVVQVIF